MTHPNEINAETVDVFAVAHLRVFGHSTVGACVGILRPRVLVDRAVQLQPGFEALMYHEGTHAHERHRFVALLILLPFVLGPSLAVGLGWFWPLLLVIPSAACWAWWCRMMESRADAVALYGSGHREFYSFLKMVGTPASRWGKWCYGGSMHERTLRAVNLCTKRGWSVGA